MGPGRGGKFGADSGECAGYLVGGDRYVDAAIVVEVDEQGAVFALAHGDERQRNRFSHGVVEETRVGADREVPNTKLPRLALEWRWRFDGFLCDEDVETVGANVDAEYLGPRYAGPVGGVGQDVTEAGEPEQAVGSGVMAELELEVGQWAVRRRKGDTSTRGAAGALAPPTAIEGTDQSEGSEAEDAGADGQGPDFIT